MIIYILHRLAINSFRFPFRSAFLLHTPNFNLSLEKACIKVTRCAAGHAGHVDHDFDSILKKKILIIPCGLQPTAADYLSSNRCCLFTKFTIRYPTVIDSDSIKLTLLG